MHSEVYIGQKKVLTSQLAFPDSSNAAVYAQVPYNKHANNTSVRRNAADMVFSETPATLTQTLFHVVPAAATGGYTIGLPV